MSWRSFNRDLSPWVGIASLGATYIRAKMTRFFPDLRAGTKCGAARNLFRSSGCTSHWSRPLPKRTTIAGSSVRVVRVTPFESTTRSGDSDVGVARLKTQMFRIWKILFWELWDSLCMRVWVQAKEFELWSLDFNKLTSWINWAFKWFVPFRVIQIIRPKLNQFRSVPALIII